MAKAIKEQNNSQSRKLINVIAKKEEDEKWEQNDHIKN